MHQINHQLNRLLILAFGFGCFFLLVECEKEKNPIKPSSNTDFCNPTPPDSHPGRIGEWELTGLKSDSINPINVISIHPEKPYILFVGTTYNFSNNTEAHLFRSVDYGTTWDTLGYAFGNGANFNDVTFNPSNPNIIYVVNGKVLFKSNDCGENWEDITGNIHVDWETDIRDIAINPENTDMLYAGTGGFNGGHLYKSLDGGNHWKRQESDVVNGPYCITFDPKNSNIIYVIVEWIGSIAKSIDGGENWTYTGLHNTGLMIYDILIDDENTDIIYAAVDHFFLDPEFDTDLGIMKSKDGGITWERFNNGLPNDKNFKPHRIIKNINTGDLYLTLTLGNGGNTCLYKMISGSSSWEIINEWPRSDPPQGSIMLSPTGEILYLGSRGMYRMRLS